MRQKIKKVFKFLIIFLVITVMLAALFGFLAFRDINKATAAQQDLEAVKSHLADAKRNLQITQKILLPLYPIRVIPLFGWYIADLQRGVNAGVYGLESAISLVDAAIPYADVLGLK